MERKWRSKKIETFIEELFKISAFCSLEENKRVRTEGEY